MLVLLLGASAFAVDLGWILLNGSRLQRAADAASLAGVVNLPASPGGALADAVDAAGRNGFPISVNGATTLTPTVLADHRYKVDLTTTIDTFFLKALGFSDFELFKTSTAEYIKPVRLGSPDNAFGGPDSNFWAAINGQYTFKEQGDPYATQCIETPTTGSPQCSAGSDNDEFRDWGYYYAIEIGAGSANLMVELYDPAHQVAPEDVMAVDDEGNPILDDDGNPVFEIHAGSSTSDTGDRSWMSNFSPRFVDLTFRILAPDQTPLDPFDNPEVCQETFTANDPSVLNQWTGLCNGDGDLQGSLTPGIWLLNIRSPEWEGSSSFGIQADVGSGPAPKIYGLFDMSIYVNLIGDEATPFLAEVRPEHEGKTFHLDIFDMGDNDGTAWIEILEPDGSVTECSWEADTDSAPMGNCHIDISDRRFNAEWLNLTIPLDGYVCNPAADPGLECWWKIKIHNEGQAHDRTTWTATITGNPLRLSP
jgi:hypothetical protein